ncbi:NYN domain-containing protein [Nocardioides hwasunensis]|uniref:NYN domain-containing protein n=1 Tax=Nocardioides hwasunensis TaxID=397258 RepID=A0ABR8MMQ4_9ACTN|nr:NYN domain-containing protein [Nocardioides hwasunensis]MBD3915364.1 NYN domain-containing protein [Nocardioides hwasunensis]
MIDMMQSRGATLDNDSGDGSGTGGESELTALVRRWMSVGRHQERLRRDSVLQVAPRVDDVRPAPEPTEPDEPVEAVTAGPATPWPAPAESSPAEPVPVVVTRANIATTPPPSPRAFQPATPRIPALPHRPTADEVEHAPRIAVLIDARRVTEDIASGLLTMVAERGAVNVCRAYADWTRSDLGGWVGRMRRQGLHSFHQFADDDDQALVALAIDAVDIARDAAIDEIVIAGDMTSMLPLVHRLHAAGVRVVVVGPAHTPHDVRAACDEFLDAGSVGSEQVAPAGKHRA